MIALDLTRREDSASLLQHNIFPTAWGAIPDRVVVCGAYSNAKPYGLRAVRLICLSQFVSQQQVADQRQRLFRDG